MDGLVRAVQPGHPEVRVLDLDTAADARIADFLAEIAHTDGGFVARTTAAERALALLAATVAALCGEDIRGAMDTPDIDFLNALKPPAIEATRGVLLAIETPEPAELTEALTRLLRP